MQTFDELFRLATGYTPHGYQRRIARDGLPDIVEAPTGTGKTGIILAWLWRRFHSPETTPRRLIYALPQRSLVDQVAGEVGKWLARTRTAGEVALHVVMGGGPGRSQRRLAAEHAQARDRGRHCRLARVNKALNRGYGIGRAIFPIDFALVTNGAHWVIDEIQLCPESTTTLRQLAGFTRQVPDRRAVRADLHVRHRPRTAAGDRRQSRSSARRSEICDGGAHRRAQDPARRRADDPAARREPGDYKAIAAAARDRHRPGELTLVVLNTVDAARQVYKQLRTTWHECTLLHSRFRGDRARAADGSGHRAAQTTASWWPPRSSRPGSISTPRC